MVKLLFCGDVDGNWSALVARLTELQQSAHGPFDALFLVGRYIEKPSVEDKFKLSDLPIKSYAFDKSFRDFSMPNLETFCEQEVGIVNVVHNLTVGFVTTTDQKSDFENLRKVSSSAGYRGCDILITSEWPREMHHFLEENELKDFRNLSIGIGSGSKTSSSVATLLKPRYHFVSGKGCFYQRSPYRNVSGDPSNCFTFTRLISIDKVSASKDKSKKWMHALSFNPIINLSNKEVTEEPVGTTDCPYVTVGEKLVSNKQQQAPTTLMGSNQGNSAKRPRTENEASGGSGAFFFGNMGVPRGESGANVSLNLEAPSTTINTLFIGGLSRDLTDYELKSSLPNATLVKRPPGKAFAFVEFSSHAAAKKVVEASARHGLVVRGRTLTVGWGKERDSRSGAGGDDGIYGGASAIVYERQLVPPTSEAKTLFVGGLPSGLDASHLSLDSNVTDGEVNSIAAVSGEDAKPILSAMEQSLLDLFEGAAIVSQVPGKSYAFVEFESYDAAMAVVTRSIQETVSLQGKALTIGWAKGDVINSVLNRQQTREIISAAPSEDSRVLFVGNLSQSASESDVHSIFGSAQGAISSTRRPEGKDFAFVEFATPGEAQEAINIASAADVTLHDAKVLVGWARGRAADKSTQSADCWFCLASPVVKVHLVLSVGEHSYVALPRGGVTDMHVLIAPIDCVPSRVHLSVEAKLELVRYQGCIDALHRKSGHTAMRFERALRTKGSRDHMQVHVIPFAAHLVAGGRALSLFMQKASGQELKFHEIQDSSKSIDEVVLSMEGGPFQEYFYIELPIAANDKSGNAAYRRFVYVNEDSAHRFPMQFGIELAAEIMGQPEKAHWKNCLLSEDGEQELAGKFRDAFAPFDFTL